MKTLKNTIACLGFMALTLPFSAFAGFNESSSTPNAQTPTTEEQAVAIMQSIADHHTSLKRFAYRVEVQQYLVGHQAEGIRFEYLLAGRKGDYVVCSGTPLDRNQPLADRQAVRME